MNQNLNDIKNIIEKNIDLINYHSQRRNEKPKADGEYYVSTEYLDKVKDNDTVIGEYRYMYNFNHLKISDKLYSYVEKLFPEYVPVVSGHFYYPKGGYMSWHTNSDKPEKHVYITYVDEPNKSFFRSYTNGEIVTDWDLEKLNVRVFDVVDSKPYYWHCVYSNCNRYSFGFRLFPK